MIIFKSLNGNNKWPTLFVTVSIVSDASAASNGGKWELT